ncbi:MAG: hypothetical protein GY739_05370 [Mesoflavibacter sp.]|nr:hypothetical protein [Mesoflavibacter sp.]
MSNISVQFDIDSVENSEFHKSKLEFANKLLDYYNNRLGLSISLKYDKDFEFKHINYSNDDLKCASFVENSAYWSFQDRSVDSKWLYSFISRKRNLVDNIKSPFYSAMAMNNLRQSDVDFFNYQKDRFKALYKDFDCFTFLLKENQNKLKLNLNSLCNELDEII